MQQLGNPPHKKEGFWKAVSSGLGSYGYRRTSTADGFESITVEIGGQIVNQQDGSSNPSRLNFLLGENHACIVQPEIRPAEAMSIPTSSNQEEQIKWASRQVKDLQAEIQEIKSDVTTQTRNVTSINQDIEYSQRSYDKHLHNKQEEIARVLRELENQHRKKSEVFETKLINLKESKQSKLQKLKRYILKVSRKEKELVHFQSIVDYYNNKEDIDKIRQSMVGRAGNSILHHTSLLTYVGTGTFIDICFLKHYQYRIQHSFQAHFMTNYGLPTYISNPPCSYLLVRTTETLVNDPTLQNRIQTGPSSPHYSDPWWTWLV